MPNRRFNKQVPGHGYKHGGLTSNEALREELGRVDAERGRTRVGRRNLQAEETRIRRELRGR